MESISNKKITLDLLKDLPQRKARQAFVYLNARRYGLTKTDAAQCVVGWHNAMATCFTQAVAGEVYNQSKVSMIAFPHNRSGRELYMTAHFSAYTMVPIALARHYDRPLYVLVGQPPKEWEDTLISSMNDAQVNCTIVRSSFSQLKRIKHAIAEDAVILSLIDVPWHRNNEVVNRDYQKFDFGTGKILASRSIFKIAEIMDMIPSFVLCKPSQEGFDVVHYGNLTQQECFEKLANAVADVPSHFERFCEIHHYYEGGDGNSEIVTYQYGENRYVVDSVRKKYWKFGENLSAYLDNLLNVSKNVQDASSIILAQINNVTGVEYDEVVYF